MNHVGLFEGSGIPSLCAQRAGMKTVAIAESDPWCCYALERLWPEAKLFRDVRDVSADALRRSGCLPVDLVTGGFPCVDISTAGKGEGIHAERSGLWFEMLRIIDEIRPTWVLTENVPPLRMRGGDVVLDGLERIGYACWPVVVGADDAGAPHRRKRVWIVANRSINGCERERVSETEKRNSDGDSGGPDRRSIILPDSPRLGRQGEGDEQRGLAGGGDGEAMGDSRQKLRRKGRNYKYGTATERSEEAGITERPSEAVADAENHNRRGGIGATKEGTGPDEIWRGRLACGSRWPSRPGEPQHDWEWERLLRTDREFVAKPGDPSYSRWTKKAGEPLGTLGKSTDGLAGRIHSRANKALLRVCGNGWVYPLAQIIFDWIAEQEREPNPEQE